MNTEIKDFSDRLDYIFDMGFPTKAMIIDAFIKSINSEHSKETPNIKENKEVKKVCDCIHAKCSFRSSKVCMTKICGDYIKQTD